MIYLKSNQGDINLSNTSYAIKNMQLDKTNAKFGTVKNDREDVIYTGYVTDQAGLQQGTTNTKIPIPSEWLTNYRYIWIDTAHSFVTTTYASYPIIYTSQNTQSYLSAWININNQEIVLTHSTNWGGYIPYVTLQMSI